MNDETYFEAVKNRTREVLANSGYRFIHLVRACQGAYPGIVRQALMSLGFEVVKRQSDIVISSQSCSALSKPSISALAGIEGNPILSSWYFTDATCERFERLWDWSRHRIAFLGTPRVFEWFRSANLGATRLLLDLDPVVTAALGGGPCDSVRLRDVRDSIPPDLRGQFTCVICDPPWYPQDYGLWIERAAELAPSGLLCISLFPELTRPGATSERSALLSLLQSLHQSVIRLSDFLEYAIPSFELFELAEIGLWEMGPWKLADLIIIRLTNYSKERAGYSNPDQADWIEVDVGTFRLFVNPGKRRSASGPLLSPQPNGSIILPSPSRREPALEFVNVLSSRGHGLVSDDPLRLLKTLQDLTTRLPYTRDVAELIATLPINIGSKEILRQVLCSKAPGPLFRS